MSETETPLLVSVGGTFTTTAQDHRPEVQAAIHADEMARADRLKAVQKFTAEAVRLNPAPDFHGEDDSPLAWKDAFGMFPEDDDEWPVDDERPICVCAACGASLVNHLGHQGTCAKLQAARQALRDIESVALSIDEAKLARMALDGLEASE